MKVINSMLTAFGMYSKIPVPRPQWKKEYMDYVMCFFPLVGAVMGVALYIFWHILLRFGVNQYFSAALCTVLPLYISGGIHMDGYLDTADALASYGSREKKLEILKDSHAGAFAVIKCAVYFVLSFGAWMGIQSERGVFLICVGYVISRCLSGLSVMMFQKAKKEGSSVTEFADAAQKKLTIAVLFICLLTAAGAVILKGREKGVVLLVLFAAAYGYYFFMSRGRFGGITGDLAGYFLQLSELINLCAVTVLI